LAGAEAWGSLLLELGVPYQLMSYFYFRTMRAGTKAHDLLAKMRRAHAAGYRFMLDSGAFTYNTKANMPGAKLPEPRGYFQEYKNFIQDHGDLFEVIVELDIDNFGAGTDRAVSLSEVDDWTNELFSIREIGPKIMPVYHASRGPTWLRDWLLDTGSPYIGFGSSGGGGAAAFVAQARRFGKAAHGFAQTRIKTELKYAEFYSVDSSTWLRADKFGGTCIFQEGRFTVLDHLHKADRRLYRRYFESWGLDWAKIAKDDLHEMRKSTIIAWRELGKHLEKQAYARNAGKDPYLLEAAKAGIELKEHPVITKARKEQNG